MIVPRVLHPGGDEEQILKVAAGVRTTAQLLITGRVGVFVIPSAPLQLQRNLHSGGVSLVQGHTAGGLRC